jgi:CheY-like chemotaxis protein
VRLAKTLASGSAAIVGDPTQLHQVVMNLCTNAIQAMPDDGVMEVTLERVDVPLPCRVSHGALAARPYVRLRVADTGTGIPPAVRERIFDPFFTTKGVGEGTGLGLALVHGIVSDLGGAIDVSTILGQGTTFAIWLPIEGEAAEVKRDACRALPTGDGQTILVIDDERPLVMLVEETLAGLGYEAVGFDSSSDAIGAFRAAPRRFDAVLTDETMPGLKGTDLAPALRALRPDIPIILMSGYAGTQLIEHARRAGVTEILRKPLQRRDIAESLGRILGAARRRSFAPVSPEAVASASVIEEQPQATPIASQ